MGKVINDCDDDDVNDQYVEYVEVRHGDAGHDGDDDQYAEYVEVPHGDVGHDGYRDCDEDVNSQHDEVDHESLMMNPMSISIQTNV